MDKDVRWNVADANREQLLDILEPMAPIFIAYLLEKDIITLGQKHQIERENLMDRVRMAALIGKNGILRASEESWPCLIRFLRHHRICAVEQLESYAQKLVHPQSQPNDPQHPPVPDDAH